MSKCGTYSEHMSVFVRQTGIVALIIVSSILLLVPVVLFVTTRSRPQDTTVRLPDRSPTPADSLARETKTPSGNTTKGEFQDGRYYISVNGLVSGAPKQAGSILSFHVIANDDTQRHIVPVTLDGTGSTVPVGVFTGSFDGVYTTKLATVEEIMSEIAQGRPIQLRFMYYPDKVLDAEQVRERQMLESFVNGVPKVSEDITLVPVGIGVIQ